MMHLSCLLGHHDWAGASNHLDWCDYCGLEKRNNTLSNWLRLYWNQFLGFDAFKVTDISGDEVDVELVLLQRRIRREIHCAFMKGICLGLLICVFVEILNGHPLFSFLYSVFR